MAILEWTERYSVHVDKFDEQHKMLVSLLNELHEAIRNGSEKYILGRILGDLVEYTETHFQDEEDLMEEYDYPELQQHKDEHDKLTKKVKKLKSDFDLGNTKMSVDLMYFLKEWLLNHILKTDKAYASFFKEEGID